MVYGVFAYVMWGVFPAFFPLLLPASPLEILAHRILWTALFMVLLLSYRRSWKEFRTVDRSSWLLTIFASLFISLNWLIYVIAINSERVSEAALGYFINPLVSVVLGVIVFREQLRRLQFLAVIIAGIAVLLLTFLSDQPPFLALSLAATFGIYGALKKKVKMSAMGSLTAETLILVPLAVGYIVWLELSGAGTFFSEGIDHAGLLISSGLVTAIPLLMFGIAAKKIPLSVIGMLQYLTPTVQMIWAITVVNEQLSPIRWLCFSIIWLAIALYLIDTLRRKRSPQFSAD